MISTVQPENIKTKYTQRTGANEDETINRLELERIRAAAFTERSSFIPHWQEINQFLAPRRARFWTTDRDRGNRRNYSIINSTGTHAWHTLQAGMMSGFTSQSRQWFRLSTLDPDLAKVEAVKEWLDMVSWMMSDVFLRSNIYTTLMNVYGDMGGFATGCMFLEEDFDRVIHTYSLLCGSYMLIPNAKWETDGIIRDYMMTVRQIVEKFACNDGQSRDPDWTNISSLVKGLWDAGTTEVWLDVSHAILPNPKWKPESQKSEHKKYMSVYWERGSVGSQYTISTVDSTKVLRRRGYDKFRAMAPRWEVGSEDIYGVYCPGMESLGDVQGLQTYEKRGAQALEKSINPAMKGPASLKNAKASVVPGDITYVDTREGQQQFEPVYMINPNFQQYNIEKQAIQDRIKKSFKEDLFLVISNIEHGNITAEQVRALQGEKLQEIGPIIAPLNQGLLDPLVEQTFDIMQAQGRLPPPPQVLRNRPLKVVYLSIVGQAQKAIAAGAVEQFWGFCMKVQEARPEDPSVLDPVNTDEMLDKYAEDLTVPPGIIRDEDAVTKMRAQRQQAQAKQQQLAAAEQQSKTAKNLAQAPTQGANALSDLLEQGKAGAMQ